MRELKHGLKLGTEYKINYGSRTAYVHSMEYRINVGHWARREGEWAGLEIGAQSAMAYWAANIGRTVDHVLGRWVAGIL